MTEAMLTSHSNSNSKSSNEQLDLASLTSYSPSWPPTLRFAVCIAVKHASASLCKRVEALTIQSNSNLQDQQVEDQDEQEAASNQGRDGFSARRLYKKKVEFKQDWQDFSDKVSLQSRESSWIAKARSSIGSRWKDDTFESDIDLQEDIIYCREIFESRVVSI